MSILVELLSKALGAPRDQVENTLDQLEAKMIHAKSDISRRVGAALARNDSSSEATDELVAVAHTLNDDSTNKLLMKLVLAVGGAAWGAGIASAALSVGATSVAVGLGVTVGPLVALVFAAVLLYISGQCAFGVIRELASRITSASSDLSEAF